MGVGGCETNVDCFSFAGGNNYFEKKPTWSKFLLLKKPALGNKFGSLNKLETTGVGGICFSFSELVALTMLTHP